MTLKRAEKTIVNAHTIPNFKMAEPKEAIMHVFLCVNVCAYVEMPVRPYVRMYAFVYWVCYVCMYFYIRHM